MYPALLPCSLPSPSPAPGTSSLTARAGQRGDDRRRCSKPGRTESFEKTVERKVGEGRRSSHLVHQSMLLTETDAVSSGKWHE